CCLLPVRRTAFPQIDIRPSKHAAHSITFIFAPFHHFLSASIGSANQWHTTVPGKERIDDPRRRKRFERGATPRMKAAVLQELGKPPRFGDFAEPTARTGEALVRVLAPSIKPIDKQLAGGSHYA